MGLQVLSGDRDRQVDGGSGRDPPRRFVRALVPHQPHHVGAVLVTELVRVEVKQHAMRRGRPAGHRSSRCPAGQMTRRSVHQGRQPGELGQRHRPALAGQLVVTAPLALVPIDAVEIVEAAVRAGRPDQAHVPFGSTKPGSSSPATPL